MKYLFLAEKNSVMRAVSEAYVHNKYAIDGALGGEVIFTALSGHVCRWLEPNEYDEWKDKKWRELELPLTPEPFRIAGSRESYAKGRLEEVKKIIKEEKPDAFIVGTDSDVEGNGIYYLLANYLGITDKPTYRFFEQSLTEKEVVDSLLHMTDFYSEPRDVMMTDTFITRSQFDWLVGMNATIAITLKANELYKVGRVKAPTLKLVYDNSNAIDNFVPHSDFLVKAVYEDGFTGLMMADAKAEEAFETKEQAEDFINSLGDPKTALVKSVERKRTKSGAPALYKLSALQGEAGSKYNFTPKETLDTVQELYEAQLLTYPRTDGTFVSSAKAESFPYLIKAVSAVGELKAYADSVTEADIERVKKDKKTVNDAEVKKSSHDALLPTDKAPDMAKLSDKQKKIYLLVAKRFLAHFLPDKEDIKTTLMAEISGKTFKSSGSVNFEPGWSILYDKKDNAETIPDSINNGDTIGVSGLTAHEKVSKPPARLTSASLVTAMENISKYIEDKDLKKVMTEAKGIGTQATRADIIDQLISTGYIRTEGKNNALFITDMGKRYMDTVKLFSIADPSSAAEWETVFKDVREGTLEREDAAERTIDYVYDFLDEVVKADIKRYEKEIPKVSAACPYCGGKILVFEKVYMCEHAGKENACTFKIFNTSKKIKPSDVEALITKGKTRVIKGIGTSKAGNPFDAKLTLNPKGSRFVTGFEFPEKKYSKKG